MKTLLLATALALTTGAAFADTTIENTVVLSYDSFKKDDVRTEGFKLDVEGAVNDFGYEGYAFDGDAEGFNAQASGLKANWTGWNLGEVGVGPAMAYDHASTQGLSSSDFAVGAAMKTTIGTVDIKGDAVFSTDINNAWRGTIDGRFPIGDKVTGLGKYSYVDVGDQFESHQFELGARYDLTNSVFIEGTFDGERSAGSTGSGGTLGLGLKF
jgi:FlaG/FlaF family flagellin (archaellin)